MNDSKVATWIWITLIIGINVAWLVLYLWMSMRNEIPPCEV